jgi:IS30 family transposase
MGNHYSQLSMDERNQIHRCSNEGLSLRAIARRLNRPTSAVSREVARNTVGKSYDAARAERATLARRRRGTIKLKSGSVLLNRVRALMAEGWSPEQVAGRLRRMNPDDPALHVSHETIYCAIYAVPRGELRNETHRPAAFRPQGPHASRTGPGPARHAAEHDLHSPAPD